MTKEELALQMAQKYVNDHPLMFTEDKEWWSASLSLLLIRFELKTKFRGAMAEGILPKPKNR